MTDIFGPASALNAVTTRPPETRTFGLLDTWFQPCSAPGKQDGTQLQAVWANGITATLRMAVDGMGVARVSGDDSLLLKAIQAATVRYAVDTSATVNTIVVAPTPPVTAWTPGLSLRILVANAVTGPTNVIVSGVPGVALKRADGTAIQQGDIGAGDMIEVASDGTALRLQSPRRPIVTDGVTITGNGTTGSPFVAYGSNVIVAIRVFLTSGQYVPSAGVTRYLSEAQGAGGSGGGGQASGSNVSAAAGGGGAGGYVKKLFPVVAGLVGTIVIGAGGVGVPPGQNGNPGGTTTFTYNSITLTAGGGSYGTSPQPAATGGYGGIASGGDLNVQGMPGGPGGDVGFPAQSGHGGSSKFGSGGFGAYGYTNKSATDGGLGAGGGGGSGGFNSGNGGNGVVVVTEYR